MIGFLAKKLKNELTYLQREASKKVDQVQAVTGRVNNAIVQPLRTHTVNFTAELQRNLRAEAALRGNQRQENKPAVVTNPRYPNVSQRTIKSGGIESSALRTATPGNEIKIGGKVVHTGQRDVAHDISFHRDTVEPGDGLNPRRNISPANARVRQANIKYQLGQLLSEVQPGDRVTADPITSDNGRNPRATLYDRATKGALKARIEDYGDPGNPYISAEVDSSRGSNNRWTNIHGERKTFDPETLKNALKELAKGQIKGKAIRAVTSHPAAQAAVLLDEIIGGITGERASERIGRGHKETVSKSIKERLKKGERFFNPQQLPF